MPFDDIEEPLKDSRNRRGFSRRRAKVAVVFVALGVLVVATYAALFWAAYWAVREVWRVF